MKQAIHVAAICLGILLFQSLPAKSLQLIDDPEAKYRGLSLLQAKNGSGIGGYFEWSLNVSNRIAATLNFLIVRGENDYPIYDPYYDPYGYYAVERSDKTRLQLLSITPGYKRVLFVDKLDNNFRPFLMVGAGPVLAIDPPNIPDLSERIKQIRFYYSGILSVGGGIDFVYGAGTIVSLFFGYELVRFPYKIDLPDYLELLEEEELDASQFYTGRRDFSGLILKISFGRKY